EGGAGTLPALAEGRCIDGDPLAAQQRDAALDLRLCIRGGQGQGGRGGQGCQGWNQFAEPACRRPQSRPGGGKAVQVRAEGLDLRQGRACWLLRAAKPTEETAGHVVRLTTERARSPVGGRVAPPTASDFSSGRH